MPPVEAGKEGRAAWEAPKGRCRNPQRISDGGVRPGRVKDRAQARARQAAASPSLTRPNRGLPAERRKKWSAMHYCRWIGESPRITNYAILIITDETLSGDMTYARNRPGSSRRPLQVGLLVFEPGITPGLGDVLLVGLVPGIGLQHIGLVVPGACGLRVAYGW